VSFAIFFIIASFLGSRSTSQVVVSNQKAVINTDSQDFQTNLIISPSPTIDETVDSIQDRQKIQPIVTSTTIVGSTPTETATNDSTNSGQCISVNGLPDSSCTPGSTDPRVTQDNIQSTICKSGYTTTVRPPTSYTNNLKIIQIKEYGFADTRLSSYEEDHLIPLELGGNPTDPKNLWPEPGDSPNAKDKVENYCKKEVCLGQITLKDAQEEIANDWYTACGYKPTVISIPIVDTSSVVTSQPQVTIAESENNGATGECNDGTYTYAANHRGACSHHDGVKVWY